MEKNSLTVGSPQQSTKSFTSPVGIPIKKTPPITDIIHDKIVLEPPKMVQENINEEKKEIREIKVEKELLSTENSKSESLISEEPTQDFIEINSSPIEEKENTLPSSVQSDQEETKTFAIHWEALFEELFKNIPIIYFPLKGYIPQIKDNKIHLNLKNEIQKEHFEPKIREVLSYLRTHYSDLIDDVIVNVDETIVTRKIIYDTVDKLKNLNEQNIDFEEFNSILNLKVKD